MSECWPLDLETTRKFVLITLADYADDDGNCWPSIASLCKRTSLSERTVRRAIRDLEACGYLRSQQRFGDSTKYVVTPVTVTGGVRVTGGHSDRGEGSQWPGRGVTVSKKGGHCDPRITIEPSRTVIEPLPEGSDDPPVEAAPKKSKPEKAEAASGPTWIAYQTAYRRVYGIDPVRNAKANALAAQLVKRLGADEAPRLAAHYLTLQKPLYRERSHPLDLLVRDCEGLRTEMLTGRNPHGANDGKFDPARYVATLAKRMDGSPARAADGDVRPALPQSVRVAGGD